MAHLLKLLLYILGGGIAGYLYYRFIGCSTGVCPITSRPIPSIIYGAAIGALLGWR